MMIRAAVLVLGIVLLCGHAAAAPPTDADVEAATAEVLARVKGLQPPALFEERAKAVREVMARLGVDELTLPQVQTLMAAGLLTDPSQRGAILARLGRLAEEPTENGAIAACLRLDFVSPDVSLATTPEDKAAGAAALGEAAARALLHPAIGQAWKSDRREALTMLSRLRRADPAPLARPGVVEALEKAIEPGVSGQTVVGLLTLLDVLAGIEPAPREAIERLRTRTLAAAEAVATANAAEEESKAILTRHLRGAFARGELMGKQAPALPLTFCDAKPEVKGLADLKGRVVVVLFWSARARPSMRWLAPAEALRARYEGSPVTVLALTSLQGIATDYTDPKKPQRMDTTNHPELEHKLTRDLLNLRKVSVPLAFCESLLNADYGITRVPTVVVIDPDGIVRHRGLDLLQEFDDACAKLDTILARFSMPVPAKTQTPPAAPAEAGGSDKDED